MRVQYSVDSIPPSSGFFSLPKLIRRMELRSTSAYDHLLKILLIGDAGSGKRLLLQKYIGDEEMSDTTTLGVCVCVCVCSHVVLPPHIQTCHFLCIL